MKHESESPIKVETTDANVVANEIGKNMGYSIQTPKSHLMSYEQFVKAASSIAPATTSEEKKTKLQ
jgi:hypothetical protein